MAAPRSPLSIHSSPILPGRTRRRTRPPKLEFNLNTSIGCDLPNDMTPLESQVGGHAFGDKCDTIGMLKNRDGLVYKPIEKPLLGEREIMFYERLNEDTTDPLMLELRQYTPQYYGTKEFQLGDKSVKFLILKDLTEGMSEPCVMDVKIGRRTWDPLSGPAKRAGEEKKYAECKREYGFCIPGFQVFKPSCGTVKKYNKEFGKKLDKKMVVEAMELFLNAKPGQPPCRNLIVQLLSTLWKILAFFRLQKKFRFYSSSVLLVYDAKRLRQHSRPSSIVSATNNNVTLSPNSYLKLTNSIARTPSIKLNLRPVGSLGDEGFSGQLTESGPVFQKTINNHSPISTPTISPIFMRRNKSKNKSLSRSSSLKRSDSLKRSESFNTQPSSNLSPESCLVRNNSCGRGMNNVVVEKLCRTHSYTNNFDKDILKMKEDYAILLDQLTTTPEEKQNWVRVNMIDFAHVFPAENDGIDTNYLEGMENLIKLLESFLSPEQ